jgi:hypothetical protein
MARGAGVGRALPYLWVIGYRASNGAAAQPLKNPREHLSGTRLARLRSQQPTACLTRKELRIQCSTIATEGAPASVAEPRVLNAYRYVSSGNRIRASAEYRSYSFNRLTGTSTICLTSGERGLMIPVPSPSRNALNPCLGRHR